MDPCPGPNVGEHHPIHPKECAAKIFWMPDLILRSERVGRVRRALYTQYDQTANVNSYNSQQQHTTSLGPGRFSLYGIHRRTPQCATRCERRRATARHGVQVQCNCPTVVSRNSTRETKQPPQHPATRFVWETAPGSCVAGGLGALKWKAKQNLVFGRLITRATLLLLLFLLLLLLGFNLLELALASCAPLLLLDRHCHL